jgi:hypothetical protein
MEGRGTSSARGAARKPCRAGAGRRGNGTRGLWRDVWERAPGATPRCPRAGHATAAARRDRPWCGEPREDSAAAGAMGVRKGRARREGNTHIGGGNVRPGRREKKSTAITFSHSTPAAGRATQIPHAHTLSSPVLSPYLPVWAARAPQASALKHVCVVRRQTRLRIEDGPRRHYSAPQERPVHGARVPSRCHANAHQCVGGDGPVRWIAQFGALFPRLPNGTTPPHLLPSLPLPSPQAR